MALFNRSQLRNIFTGFGDHVGDDVADVLEEGVRNLAPKEDVDSLRVDIRQMFAEFEERIVAKIEAKFYRAFFALAVFFIALYGATVGLMIAFFG